MNTNEALYDHAAFCDVEAEGKPTRRFTVTRKGQEINFDSSLTDVEAYETLKMVAKWSTFAADLVAHIEAGQTPSQTQIAWIFFLAEDELKRNVIKSVQPKPQTRAGLSQIFNTLKNLSAHYQAPVLRLGGKELSLRITWAKENSPNRGCLYVCDANRNYLGKVTPEGEFKAIREVSAELADKVIDTLKDFECDPRKAVVRYGQLTGHCAICGRLLTNEGSVEAGIGPVCASKGGF